MAAMNMTCCRCITSLYMVISAAHAIVQFVVVTGLVVDSLCTSVWSCRAAASSSTLKEEVCSASSIVGSS